MIYIYNIYILCFILLYIGTTWLKRQNTSLFDMKCTCKLKLANKACIVFTISAAMIHWTRQIKEVLSAQDSLQTSENAGPMEEIDFWKNRCADLSGISDQLDKLGVKRITEILQLAKSSYVNAFLKLSGQIKVCWPSVVIIIMLMIIILFVH